MPRQKGYERDAAVAAAMHAFWQHGYGAVGVRQIERETAINRFALQTEFGGKPGLFADALKAYLEMSRETVLRPLAEGGLDGIREFFRLLVTGEPGDPRNAGCLMVNTVIENAHLGLDGVREITTAHYDGMQRMLGAALERSREAGELKADFDTEAAARYLLTFAMGVEVYVRMSGDLNAARTQVDFLLIQVDGWQQAV